MVDLPVMEPIILVHGFGGWGREDIPAFYYWGGFQDLEASLRESGYQVYSAVVGPFSSNWDRTCELFACIKGGTVDYGEHHAQRYGHERFGASYPGVYPEWSEEKKVHLIGHSMGGLTSRLLAYLLKAGDEDEREVSGGECHELFRDSGQWVRSITTLSTPHNGSALFSDIKLVDLILQNAITAMASAIESRLFPSFDLKMDHWGISRQEDESLGKYFGRVRNHEIWTEHDFSIWDLSVPGCTSFNGKVVAEPDVYYFSWANEETTGTYWRENQIPEIGMLPLFMPGGVFLGSFGGETLEGVDDGWKVNDGVVNTISMKGPFLGSTDTIVDFDGNPKPGVWNYMGVLSSIDHGDIIGIPGGGIEKPEGFESITDFYVNLCAFVSRL